MLWLLNIEINVMNKFLYVIFILVFNIVYSQKATPQKYSNIKFVYEQRSNFLIQEGILYADTLLFSLKFPLLKVSKIKSPADSSKIIGIINMELLNKKEKDKLYGILDHNTHTIEGNYNLKKNQTKLFFKRGSKELKAVGKKYFGRTSSNFMFNVIIDYNKKKIYVNYPKINYIKTLDTEIKNIVFLNANKDVGTYSFQTNQGYQTDTIVLNNNHVNDKITTDFIFSNNAFAVESIVSLFNITKLISVDYE
jgi:hypothetical protein